MAKVSLRRDKYFLRELHQEIDLYDRKIAHLGTLVESASSGDREQAEKLLLAKRAPLERTALELAASGVEFDEKDLPRSFRAAHLVPSASAHPLALVKSS